jgi:hypothetical protein
MAQAILFAIKISGVIGGFGDILGEPFLRNQGLATFATPVAWREGFETSVTAPAGYHRIPHYMVCLAETRHHHPSAHRARSVDGQSRLPAGALTMAQPLAWLITQKQ